MSQSDRPDLLADLAAAMRPVRLLLAGLDHSPGFIAGHVLDPDAPGKCAWASSLTVADLRRLLAAAEAVRGRVEGLEAMLRDAAEFVSYYPTSATGRDLARRITAALVGEDQT